MKSQEIMKMIVKCTFLFLLIVLSLFTFGTNPIWEMPNIDSSVFLYVGRRMHDGLLPYRDVFDHKGVLLYMIQYVGLALSGGRIYGVWIVEAILYLASLMLIYRMLRRFFEEKVSQIVLIIYILLFCRLSNGGNISETYGHFFIVAGYYQIILGLSDKVIDARRSFFFGVCAGAVSFLKPTFVAVGLPGAIAILLPLCKRDGKIVARNIISVAVGVLSVVGLMSIYLWRNGLFSDFWDCYIKFNMEYASHYSQYDYIFSFMTPSRLMMLDRTAKIWLVTWLVNICFFGLMFMNAFLLMKKAHAATRLPRRILFVNLVFLAVSMFAMYVCGFLYWYYSVVIPAGMLPLAVAIDWLVQKKKHCILMWFGGVISIVLIVLIVWNVNCNPLKLAKVAAIEEFSPLIENRESVTVINNHCIAYLKLDASTPSRYPYQTPICAIDKRIAQSFSDWIRDSGTEYLIRPNRRISYLEEIFSLRYELVAINSYYTLLKRK